MRPRLRNGVDLQLQSAFQDGNWAVAMRLAENRARTFNDQYFQIVKICAESQLDDPASKFAAVAAIKKFIKEGTTVQDIDAIDLLEWATRELTEDTDFPATIGQLRVRAVKANPKNKIAVTRCLESCLLHWDLVSAQQIAATLDRSFPADRDFLFWNIVITHLLAISDQAPQEKKKLYGTLAQKQIERAAQLTEQAHAAEAELPARGINTEEEIALLYDIVEAHGTVEDLQKVIDSAVFSPVSQFQMGRKELLDRVATRYRSRREWAALFALCKSCLGYGNLLASDWVVWEHFIASAEQLKSHDPNVTKTVQDSLLQFAKMSKDMPIYRRNVLLARVAAAFKLTTDDDELRRKELCKYIEDQVASAACFDDIREYLEFLDADGLKYLAYEYAPKLKTDGQDARVTLLTLQLQYFFATCPLARKPIAGRGVPQSQCAVCTAKFTSEYCRTCFDSIEKQALAAFISQQKLSGSKRETLPELAMVVASCNIQAAFFHRPANTPSAGESRPLVRALLILEHEYFATPKHGQIALVLVQLHLLLGSAHRAREIWNDLGVKRTIVDSLAPVFYDRLSTISPSVLDSSEEWGYDLVETLRSHYAHSLKLRMPRRLIDAFEASNYSAILSIPKYVSNIREGSTRVMSLVEESRADRLLGEPCGELLHDTRYSDVFDAMKLQTAVDYGSFPSWECNAAKPLYERLQIGPAPTNERSHLALLAEAFQDILAYKPPTVYKVATPAGMDSTFVVEMMSRLAASMARFVGARGTPTEGIYSEIVFVMATLITTCTDKDRSALSETLSVTDESISVALHTLRDLFAPEAVESLGFRSLHDLTMLHDSAVAVKMAAAWILAYNEREKERDKSGKGNLPKEAIALLKSWLKEAEDTLAFGKGVVAALKVPAIAQIKDWVMDPLLGEIIEDGTIKELVESWQLNAKGWKVVSW